MSTTNYPRTDAEITFTGATCTHHNDQQRAACPVCLVATLTAEVARLKRDYEYDHKCLHLRRERCELWKQRAMKAEADLVALEQCHDDNCRGVVRIADELATAKERLRSEAMDDYASIKDLQRELATEREKVRELHALLVHADQILDDIDTCSDAHKPMYSTYSQNVMKLCIKGRDARRAAIDAAMREDAK